MTDRVFPVLVDGVVQTSYFAKDRAQAERWLERAQAERKFPADATIGEPFASVSAWRRWKERHRP